MSKDVFIASHHGGDENCTNCHIRIRARVMERPGVYAVAENYSKVWWYWKPIIDFSGTWIYSEIWINLDENLPLIHSFRDASQFHRQQIVVHELGHSLGLNHPYSTCTEAIMYDSFSVLYYKDFNTPQQHDRNTLIAKYGNPY